MSSTRKVDHYRQLPYTRRVEPRGGKQGIYFIAYVEELPALRIDGTTREEALARLNETFGDFIEMLLEHGDEVPEPAQWPENIGVALTQKPTARRKNPPTETRDEPASLRVRKTWKPEAQRLEATNVAVMA